MPRATGDTFIDCSCFVELLWREDGLLDAGGRLEAGLAFPRPLRLGRAATAKDCETAGCLSLLTAVVFGEAFYAGLKNLGIDAVLAWL